MMGCYGFLLLGKIVQPLGTSGVDINISADFIFVILGVIIAGLVASAFPAIRAMHVDIAEQLSRNA